MTAQELINFRADLAYRYSEYVHKYVKGQFKGYTNRTYNYNINVLSGYVYFVEAYDLDNLWNTNLLSAEGMNKIILHINKILNTHYYYRF